MARVVQYHNRGYRWSVQQLHLLRELWGKAAEMKEISKRLGRSPTAIMRKLKELEKEGGL